MAKAVNIIYNIINTHYELLQKVFLLKYKLKNIHYYNYYTNDQVIQRAIWWQYKQCYNFNTL